MKTREKTIDAAGNIIDKPYGPGRWHSPRIRSCDHADCQISAVVLKTANNCLTQAHNCCNNHKESNV